MPPSGQIVRHTRAENVSGFPAILLTILSYLGIPWYPEYTVYEEYRDYGQGQFLCKVRILNYHGDEYEHSGAGMGISVEQAVQEAAYHAITRYCRDCP